MVLSHQTGVRIPVALPCLLQVWARLGLAALLTWGLLASSVSQAQPRETRRADPRRESVRPERIPANVERLDSLSGITLYRLKSNGMRILVSPNRAAPVATFLVVYHPLANPLKELALRKTRDDSDQAHSGTYSVGRVV